MRIAIVFSGIIAFLCNSAIVTGQSLPVGTPVVEDYYRRLQLTGDIDSNISFTVRPLTFGALTTKKLGSYPDSTLKRLLYNPVANTKKSLMAAVLPATWQFQYNAHHPYGWNDGAMVTAKGYQSLMSAGVFAKAGPLTIQLQPEFVYAFNRRFNQGALQFYYGQAEIPKRFGDGAYSKLTAGQSSVRLNAGPVSVGVSSENLWWGPGRRSSLLMSNNAPGFNHFTINTNRPIKTPIGSIEGQMIGGRLEGSGLATNKPDDWRYLSGFVFSYQPKWVPGLFVGGTRSFQIYSEDLGNRFSDYVPLFTPFEKIKTTDEDLKRRDQLTSFFMRWLWPKAGSEIYFEYGLNDHALNLRDFILSPEHSRTYLVGFSTVVPRITAAGDYLQIKMEVTQLQQSIDRKVRDAYEWYTHYQVVHGYTHKGQVLGAGIGPSGNLQSAEVSFGRGLNRLGLQLERYVHNNDFYLAAFPGNVDDPWVDLSAATIGDYEYNKFLFSGSLNVIRSSNYQWRNSIGEPGGKAFNVSARLAVMYRF